MLINYMKKVENQYIKYNLFDDIFNYFEEKILNNVLNNLYTLTD